MNVNVIKGDITKVYADAIVNAANVTLRGGGGVDGAIHRAAGPDLLRWESWMYPHGTGVAQPVVTPAFDLPAKHIIHVPGPDVRGVKPPPWNADEYYQCRKEWGDGEYLLWHAYARSMDMAGLLGAGTVTFPSISTGIFAFPLERAVPIALAAIRYRPPSGVRSVAIVAFDDETFTAFRKAL